MTLREYLTSQGYNTTAIEEMISDAVTSLNNDIVIEEVMVELGVPPNYKKEVLTEQMIHNHGGLKTEPYEDVINQAAIEYVRTVRNVGTDEVFELHSKMNLLMTEDVVMFITYEEGNVDVKTFFKDEFEQVLKLIKHLKLG